MDSTLIHKISEVRSKIVHACERAGRDPQSIELLLASKTVDPMIIREAFHAGVSLFGENKSQDFLEKLPSLSDLPFQWHFMCQLGCVFAQRAFQKKVTAAKKRQVCGSGIFQSSCLSGIVQVFLHVPGCSRAALGTESTVQAKVFVFDHDAFGRQCFRHI